MELTRPSNRAITHGTYPPIALITAAVVPLSAHTVLTPQHLISHDTRHWPLRSAALPATVTSAVVP